MWYNILLLLLIPKLSKSSWTSARIATNYLNMHNYSLLGEGISLPGLAFIVCVHPNG